MYMRILGIIMLFSFASFSQENVTDLTFKIELDSIGIDLEGSEIQLFQDNELIETSLSDSVGRVYFSNLAINHIYLVKIHREGFVSKLAEIDLNYALVSNKDFILNPYLKMEVFLFKPLPHENFSFLEENPIIKFYIDSEGQLEWNTAYLKRMLWKITLCEEGLTANQAENYITLLESEKFEDNEETYLKALQFGDMLFKMKNFNRASSIYYLASTLTTNNAYVLSQREKCERYMEENNVQSASMLVATSVSALVLKPGSN